MDQSSLFVVHSSAVRSQLGITTARLSRNQRKRLCYTLSPRLCGGRERGEGARHSTGPNPPHPTLSPAKPGERGRSRALLKSARRAKILIVCRTEAPRHGVSTEKNGKTGQSSPLPFSLRVSLCILCVSVPLWLFPGRIGCGAGALAERRGGPTRDCSFRASR
jgi:hypothetical protein